MTQTCLVNLFDLDPARDGGTSRVVQELSRLLTGLARRRPCRPPAIARPVMSL